MKRFFNSPVIVIFVIMVVLNVLEGDFNDIGGWIIGKLLILPGIIVGLSLHEFAHGAMSYALGDPTPKQQGRLTVNPLAHIDPIGFIALLFAGFGWGVPVEIDPRYYKHRRRDELLVSLAGVAMNLLIAVVFCFILKFVFMTNSAWLNGAVGSSLIDILINVVTINIVLMVFNLIPVPPLDGFGIVTEIFNLRKYDWYYKVYENGFFILILLIIFDVTDIVLSPCVSWVYKTLINLIIL